MNGAFLRKKFDYSQGAKGFLPQLVQQIFQNCSEIKSKFSNNVDRKMIKTPYECNLIAISKENNLGSSEYKDCAL